MESDGKLSPWQVATGAAIFVFGAGLAYHGDSSYAFAQSIGAWGFSYMLLKFVEGYLNTKYGPFAPPNLPEKKAEPEPDEPDTMESAPLRYTPWEESLMAHLVDDRFFRPAGGHMIAMPIDPEHLFTVARARYEGKLPDLSTRSLHDIGISRFDGTAGHVIDFLLSAGMIADAGERRPYVWTKESEAIFTLPHPNNGRRPYRSGGPLGPTTPPPLHH